MAPPCGWMNDPNGFCIYEDEYHLFFQYNPYSSQEAGIAHWGHIKSNNMFHWNHLPIAMYPDKAYDQTGVFSGSALVDNGTMYIMYTGNVNYQNQTPDHIQRQAVAWSTDGVEVTKFSGNPVIQGDELQPDLRDPKIWKDNNTFYAVMGNSFQNGTLGRVLLYSSPEFLSGWKLESIIHESNGSLGYMWECPDFFELNGSWVLMFSPQGIKPQGDKYNNLYQTGYIIGNFDYITKSFTPTTEFRELDHGHDFYATQTTIDKTGRRIVIAWFDMWEQIYPERNDGWTGTMTLPRELYLSTDNRLIQKPVNEIACAIGSELYNGTAQECTSVELQDNTAYIKVRAPELEDFEINIVSVNQTVKISYDYEKGKVTLDRGGNDGIRRTEWRPQGDLNWTIYVDASSIELFCGEGEETFSSRFFPGGNVTVQVGANVTSGELTVHSMQRTVSLQQCENK